MHWNTDEAIEAVYRSDWGRIVATLIRLVGDFELAEEAAQEALWGPVVPTGMGMAGERASVGAMYAVGVADAAVV